MTSWKHMRDKAGYYNYYQDLEYDVDTPETKLWLMVVFRFLVDLSSDSERTIYEYLSNKDFINEIIINKTSFTHSYANHLIKHINDFCKNYLENPNTKLIRNDFKSNWKLSPSSYKQKSGFKRQTREEYSTYLSDNMPEVYELQKNAIDFFNSDENQTLNLRTQLANYMKRNKGLFPPLPSPCVKKIAKMTFCKTKRCKNRVGEGAK